jgi:hypothetical protein
VGLVNAYARRLQLAAMRDPDIRRVFASVQHLIMDPKALTAPSMLLRVLRAGRAR